MLSNSTDQEALRQAVIALNNPSVAIKVANVLGKPIENTFAMLPTTVTLRIEEISTTALKYALQVALLGMKEQAVKDKPSNKTHKALTMLAGAGGGAFGLPALMVELPISTTLIMRSIMDIAHSEGESITSIETQLACLEVFAFGGTNSEDDSAEWGYYATRASLAKSLTEATVFMTERSIKEFSAPIVSRLVGDVAKRFSIPVSEKFISQSIPVIGALSGAAINYTFTQHFQQMATGHFVIRRLERVYGKSLVQASCYELISSY